MSKYFLGISCIVHDSAACLLKDGIIVAAVEEERFTREKHTGEFPYNAISFCLDTEGIALSDVDAIGIGYNPLLLLKNTILHTVTLKSPHYSPRARLKFFLDEHRILSQLLKTHSRLSQFSGSKIPKIRFIEHHDAHAASCFFASEFEKAAILTIDGYGEGTSTLLAVGNQTRIQEIGQIKFPSSIGLVYNAITDYLGFKVDSDEGKVMGLASYGKPHYAELFREMLRTTGEWEFESNLQLLDHSAQRVSEKFKKIMGPSRQLGEELTERHADIAASLQMVVEEVGVRLAQYLHKVTGLEALCMAGGVALNCLLNGKIVSQTSFKKIFVQPAAGDAGTALGCAAYLYYRSKNPTRSFYVMKHAFLGPEFSNDSIVRVLELRKLQYEFHDDIAQIGAKLLADRKFVGWFQGRAEFGPRALGNRSILADPRDPNIKDKLNSEVKFREMFRPYAPVVLVEAANEYFEGATPSPFMTLAFSVVSEKREQIPAVVHVDGSARLQTVEREANPLFWKLLKEFEKLTTIPILLNTSFNVRGEPIVNTPEEAINCFYSTGLDYLILGNYLLRKR